MGFEPTTLRGLVGCSNHWATGDCGEKRSNCGYRLEPRRAATQPRSGSYDLTNSIALSHEFICDALMWQRDAVSEIIWARRWLCSRAMRFQSIPTIRPLLTTETPLGLIAQLVEHCTGIAGSWVRIPFRPEFFFQALISQLLKLSV